MSEYTQDRIDRFNRELFAWEIDRREREALERAAALAAAKERVLEMAKERRHIGLQVIKLQPGSQEWALKLREYGATNNAFNDAVDSWLALEQEQA